MKKLLLLIVVCLFVGVANATTVWNPAGNGIYSPATGNWGDAANWTNGLPGTDPCLSEVKAVFNVPGAAECVVSNVQSFHQFVQGDNGPGEVIRVTAGGKSYNGCCLVGRRIQQYRSYDC